MIKLNKIYINIKCIYFFSIVKFCFFCLRIMIFWYCFGKLCIVKIGSKLNLLIVIFSVYVLLFKVW